jgi:serine/threonine-protein kinase
MVDVFERLRAALESRYAIERELGSGGMATVYLAEDLKHHRKVAVKVLRPELAAALGPERFLREIEIAAALTHPHILTLIDSGEADGFLYYVMPYIEGDSLRVKLAHEGELPVGDAVRILRDVVDALAHAHRHGVVHRDVKPDNVLLLESHALVTDFGVAKAVSEATGREKLTTLGVALGTPTYMAPEQASADPHVDHRADIYAVGVLAYELLAGRPPFSGPTPQEVLSAHVTQIPQAVTTHRPSVPPALAGLVMRCLEKKPADRWQSAEELLPQLEALMTPSGGDPLDASSADDRVVCVGCARRAGNCVRSRHAVRAAVLGGVRCGRAPCRRVSCDVGDRAS